MARLPRVGGDAGNWGEILNDFLLEAHDSSGAIKPIPYSKVTGLGSAATEDVTVFASASQGAKADTAIQNSQEGRTAFAESEELKDSITAITQRSLSLAANTVYGPRWVFDGDSITIGGQTGSTPGGGQNRNSTWTQQFTAFAMGAVDYRFNAAVSGQRLDNALARFDEFVAPHAPNVVFLTIGTNDIGQGRTLQAYLTDLEAYFEKCQAIGARLVLGAIWPTSSDSPSGRAVAVRTWNAALFGWALARSIDIVPWDRLSDPATGGWPNTWSSDLIHPGIGDSLTQIGKFGAAFLAPKLGPPVAVRRAGSQVDSMVTNGFGLTLNAPQALPTLSAATAGSGGSLTAGEYSYKATARTFWGETLPSAERTVTVGASGSVTLTVSNPSGNRNKRIYRKAPGETNWRFIATVGATTTSFVDDGSLTPTSTAPTVDTSQLVTGLTAGSSSLHRLDGVPIVREVEGIRGNVIHLTPYEGTTNEFNDFFTVTGFAPGDTLNISFLARSSGPGNTKHIIRFRDSIPATIGNYILVGTRLSTDWRLITGRVVVPSGTASIRVSFEGESTLDWAEVAEIYVSKV